MKQPWLQRCRAVCTSKRARRRAHATGCGSACLRCNVCPAPLRCPPGLAACSATHSGLRCCWRPPQVPRGGTPRVAPSSARAPWASLARLQQGYCTRRARWPARALRAHGVRSCVVPPEGARRSGAKRHRPSANRAVLPVQCAQWSEEAQTPRCAAAAARLDAHARARSSDPRTAQRMRLAAALHACAAGPAGACCCSKARCVGVWRRLLRVELTGARARRAAAKGARDELRWRTYKREPPSHCMHRTAHTSQLFAMQCKWPDVLSASWTSPDCKSRRSICGAVAACSYVHVTAACNTYHSATSGPPAQSSKQPKAWSHCIAQRRRAARLARGPAFAATSAVPLCRQEAECVHNLPFHTTAVSG